MCQHPIKLRNPNYISASHFHKNKLGVTPTQSRYGAFLEVPCGHCLDCCRSAAADYTYLAKEECKKNKTNAFITFTYDEQHVHTNVNHRTGEVTKTVCFADWTQFAKSLRRYIQYHYGVDRNAFSFFMCTEYGSRTHRPHMHALIHTNYLTLPQLSDAIRTIWKHGFVYVDPNNAGDGACAYVSKYMTKSILKVSPKEDIYKKHLFDNYVLTDPDNQLERPRRRLSNFYGLPTRFAERKNGTLSLVFDELSRRVKDLLRLTLDPDTSLPRLNTFYSFSVPQRDGSLKCVTRNIPSRFLTRALNSEQKFVNKLYNDYIRDTKENKKFIDYVNQTFYQHFQSTEEILTLPDYKLYLDAFTLAQKRQEKDSQKQAYKLHVADLGKEIIN